MAQDNLWAPWRLSYIEGIADESSPDDAAGSGCFLCAAAECGDDPEAQRAALVLINDARGVLLLNRYPYTNGHLLAAPGRHVATLEELSDSERHGLMDLAAQGSQVLRDAVNPQGINLGMNLGRCAGAGVPGHVHMHVVPRWNGDVNFMSVVGQVRVIPQAIEASYAMLREALEA